MARRYVFDIYLLDSNISITHTLSLNCTLVKGHFWKDLLLELWSAETQPFLQGH